MKKIHYSWFICIGCTLLLFCTGGLSVTGFAAYLPYLISIKHLANVQVSIIVFIRSFFGVMGMLFVNSFLRKYEIRRVVSVSLLVCAISFAAFSLSNGFAGYCLSAIIAGIAYGFGSMIPVSILISRWFNDHRGLALGICMASTGASTFIASPIITSMVEHWSLQISFIAEAVFVFVITIVVYLLLRSMPSCLDLEPLGADTEEAVQTYANKTASKPMFLAMTVGLLLLGAAANNISGNLSVLYQSVDFTSRQISTVVSIFGISLAFGKCAYGQLSDKMGVFHSCNILYLASIVGAGLCCAARFGTFHVACVAAALVGIGCASASVATSTYAVEVATEKDYPKTVSRFQTTQTLGGLLFATVPGIIADVSGDYVIAYIMMFLFILVGAVVLQSFYVLIKRRDKRYAKPILI